MLPKSALLCLVSLLLPAASCLNAPTHCGNLPACASPDDAVLSSTEEAPLDGWNSSSAAAGGSSAGADASTGDPTAPPQCYTFLYAIDSPAGGTGGSTAGTGAGAGQGPRRLLVKALPVEGSLMVNLMADPLLEGAAPSTLELQVSHAVGGPQHAPCMQEVEYSLERDT